MKPFALFGYILLVASTAVAADQAIGGAAQAPEAIVTTPFPALPKAVTSFGAAVVTTLCMSTEGIRAELTRTTNRLKPIRCGG